MRIIRHLTGRGPAYAALQADGTAREIVGDLFSEFRVTEKVVSTGKLLAPLIPTNILAIGFNYNEHTREAGEKLPERPTLFIKSTNSLQNPGDPIELPTKLLSREVDYEGELAVVIGRRCKNVSRAQALDYVFGYTAANDVSARDWQMKLGGGQFCQGKSFDTFCPLGPVLVTREEIPHPNQLHLKTILNGQTMQDGYTGDMVFDVPTLIEFLSGSKTLLAGTVILTGTPKGVGFARKPPVYLKAGDTVSVEIDRIGALTNSVMEERPVGVPVPASA